ncbi:Putative uncharacterized oxidoreductase [Verticillium dahliae VDG2]|nr:Putative uncharacterized oxidoreductase [Verticillium dahliae VDG2]
MGIGNAINACAHLNNVANARLGLTSLPATKYWNNEPVLRKMTTVTKPKRPIHIKAIDLHRVVRGFASKDGLVKGLQLGECIFLMTDQGMMEGREALSRNMGGIVLCRAR